MSTGSKFTLAATAAGTAGIVYFVHWSQERERAVSSKFSKLVVRVWRYNVWTDAD